MPSDLVAPAYLLVPEHVGTYGPEVADWGDSCGLTLDPEERLVLDGLYAYGPTGQLVATTGAVVCARQNLKTHVLLTAALADLFLFGEPGCMWTAHMRPALVDPTSGAFSVCKRVIESNDHLARYVDSISETDGEEGIVLTNGASLAFRTRSGRSGRALTGRRITLDEALYLNAATLGALVPVLSAQSMKSDVQLRYGSSAGKPESAVLRGVRDRGRAGADRRLFYAEWAARRKDCEREFCPHDPGTQGCALDDPELLQEANPALHRRISLDFVLGTERQAMSPEEFMRERFSWWEDPEPGAEDGAAIDPVAWLRLVDDVAPESPPFSWGLAVAPDRSWSAVAVAWRRADGLVQALLIEYARGTSWVPARLDAMRKVRPGPVLADVAARGVYGPAQDTTQADQARAHVALADAVEAASLTHDGHPAVTTSVRSSRWRPSGDSQVLVRKGKHDISPLAAVALAMFGLRRAGPPAPAPLLLPPSVSYDDAGSLTSLGF